MVDGVQGISWTAIKHRLLVIPMTPDAEKQYQQDLQRMQENPDWDFDDALAFSMRGSPLTPKEKISLERRRNFLVMNTVVKT